MLGPRVFVCFYLQNPSWPSEHIANEMDVTPCSSALFSIAVGSLFNDRLWNVSCFVKSTCHGSTRARIPQVPKEDDNEGKDECKAGSEDCDSDRRDDRHFPCSERSTGAIR